LPPKFDPHEIQGLFGALHYPGTIRSDAITAVGAPSSIQFLMRAIYWLYSVVKVYFFEQRPIIDTQIPEVNEDLEMAEEGSPLVDLRRDNMEDDEMIDQTVIEEERYLNEHPEERVFKELLNEAKQS
jgi:hypothetical protein